MKIDGTEFYLIRTSISHSYKPATGTYATPKLYSRGVALRVARDQNTDYNIHPSDGPWEVVPVTLMIGDPIKDTK